MRYLHLLVFCLIFISAGDLRAQLRFGIKAGANASTIATEQDSSFSSFKTIKPGFHAGGFLEWPINERFIAIGELLYSNKGAAYKGYRRNVDFITVPLLARYQFNKVGLEAGVSTGFRVLTYDNNSQTDGPGFDWSDYSTVVNVDALVGINYAISEMISLSLRYEHGLNNNIAREASYNYIRDPNDPLIVTSPTLRELGYRDRHRNFQFSIRYTFGG